MVKWVNAQNFGSPIASAITGIGQSLYGDTLTPALKREALLKAQRENVETGKLGDLFREAGNAAARRGPAPTGPVFTGTQNPAGLPQSIIGAVDRVDPAGSPMALGIKSTAAALGMDPVQLGTIMSYETAGTMNPQVAGPTTQYGQHKGLIQFGEPQAAQYGADFSTPQTAMATQLGPDGAVAKYFRGHGWQPGMGLKDAYSIVNAGAPGLFGASDANNGGAPGTVADKVDYQMGGHADRARALLSDYLPPAAPSPLTEAPSNTGYNPLNAGQFNGELYARAIAAGLDPQKAADAARGFMAGTYGAENQATTDAFVGAGGDYANTYSGFAADQNRRTNDSLNGDNVAMRGQDLAFDAAVYKDQNDMQTVIRDGKAVLVRKQDVLPTDQAVVTDSQQKGMTAGGMDLTDPQKLAYIGAEPKNPQAADTFVDGNGRAYRSVDGIHDATTGQLMPSDALKTTVAGTNRADAGLTKPVTGDLQGKVISIDNALHQIDTYAGIAKDHPELFGISGAGLRVGANVVQQWDQLQQSDPELAKLIQSETGSGLTELQKMAADPSVDGNGVIAHFLTTAHVQDMSTLEAYSAILPFTLAAALSGQSGRSVSNEDVKRFKDLIGDPTSLFGTQGGAVSKAQAARDMLVTQRKVYTDALSGGVGAAPGEPPPPEATGNGVPVIDMNDDAAYEALPPGTKFMGSDGKSYRKP